MEQTPHLPIATPSKINRFMVTPSFHRSKTHGKTQPAPWPAPPPHAPQTGCGSVTISRAPFCISTFQHNSANLYHLFCFGLHRHSRERALAWRGSLWVLQLRGGTGGHSCPAAAASHTAAPGNGHCSTKLTVHLLLAADAAESGL